MLIQMKWRITLDSIIEIEAETVEDAIILAGKIVGSGVTVAANLHDNPITIKAEAAPLQQPLGISKQETLVTSIRG
jgi:hypothetical protein